MPHALLNLDGSIAQQVFDYDPARDNPDGALTAVEIARIGDTQTHDLVGGKWKANAAKRQANEQKARRVMATRAELFDWIEALEARVAALEVKAGT